MKIKSKKILIGILITLLFLQIVFVSAQKEEIETARKNAMQDIKLMEERGIPISRTNELFNEAQTLYLAETQKEERGGNPNYEKILKYFQEVSSIKETSFQAQDELKIFNETYIQAKEELNLSEMQSDYNEIISSFNEERFEETITLIKEGYNKLSEIESKQTAINAFYSSIYKTLKNFVINNWKILVSLFVLAVIVLGALRKTFKEIKIRRKIKKLEFRRQVLNQLIAKLQKDFFEKKGSNETEYSIRINQFKKMIRDLNREIPTLKEEIIKIRRKNTNELPEEKGGRKSKKQKEKELHEKLKSLERKVREEHLKKRKQPRIKKVKIKNK